MTGRHLVLAGQGRSGSTLCYNMLRHSLSGFVMPPGEAPAEPWLMRDGNVCTKRPFDIFRMPSIAAAAATAGKRLDLIVTLRDPRDVLTSRHPRVPDDYFYAADYCYLISKDRPPAFTAPGFLPIHQTIMDVAGSGLFPQGIFFLKYEDLVARPEETQALLAAAFDLSFHARFRDFHTQDIRSDLDSAMNGARPLETTRHGKWRAPEHRARIVDQFERFPVLHDILIELGYEEDRSWFDAYRTGDAPSYGR